GTYTWHASYSGDGLNNGAIDNGNNESVTTVKASPAILTGASASAGGVLGSTSISDTATISGGDNETGVIHFTVTGPGNTTVFNQDVAISGNGTYSAGSYTPTSVGTYTWHASYAGDGLNNGAVDNGANESVTV